ncbi:MAG: GNAT family N-acetyltransferase [Anaerolineales bacterium]|nr:GNAT family N-acetyltransferase [Anaerolineales bacterium]MCZ2122665.1 GNAT family N-acetyltransferase [Anaerolineales bacterium]
MTLSKNSPDEVRLAFRTYDPFVETEQAEKIWLDLLARSAHSYFTSWGWISTWLNSLPRDLQLELIVGSINETPALAFFINRRKKNKYGFLPSQTLALNATAVRRYDEIYAEYNSILYDPAMLTDATQALEYVRNLAWDEFDFPWVSLKFTQDFNLLNAEKTLGVYSIQIDAATAFLVNLEKVRAVNLDFYALLSSNKRSQIRRSVKQYEADGGRILVREAETSEEALAMFENLVALHQAEWNNLNRPGAFSNPYVLQFHHDLIRSRFASGEIQLLQIYNESGNLGYLYCFVYCNQVLFYQSGFKYLPKNVYRPGLVSHYYAIVHNASKGRAVYDFLAGDAPYKSSLSTDTTQMYKIRWVKNKARFFIENSLVEVKRLIKRAPQFEERLKQARYLIRNIGLALVS